MFKKRIAVFLVLVCLMTSLFTACAPKEENKNKTNGEDKAEEGKDYLIGLATDEGGLNDKSFNQSADMGVKKAIDEFGVRYNPIESQSKEDYKENLEALVDEGANLVIGVGFQMREAVQSVSEKYTDTKFLIVDSAVEGDNVQSAVFKEHEGSFLMGVIAGKMTKTNKIGFVGGKDFELINKFEVGFAAGVMSVNPEAGLLLKDRKTVKYADSFGDVNKGYEIGKSLLDEGCDVIYHAAGGVGVGVFTAVKESHDAGNEVYAIGVDMDQAETLPKFKDIIVSSMIKRVNVATYNAVKDLVNDEFEGGKVIELGLKEDGVGISDTTKDKVPEEVLTIVDKYKNAIIDGTVTVPESRDALSEFKPVEME